MADPEIFEQAFAIRNLPTQSVILYPARAQVVRDIKDVSLGPGANIITIHGITPTADESSIKVDGTGSASITDMTVDLVENQERYEDVYLSESEDSTSESDRESESEADPEAYAILDPKIYKVEMSIKEISENRNAALSCLNLAEYYGRSFNVSRPENLTECIDSYSTERAKAFENHKSSESKLRELEKELGKLKKEKRKIEKDVIKKNFKAFKAKEKERKKKDRAREKKFAAKRRRREEREQFWPKKVYKVVMTLDVASDLNTSPSRRESTSSISKLNNSASLKEPSATGGQTPEACKVALSISYITYSASWSPRYDLNLSTTTKSGSITYRAEFRNTTSETWRDCKVTLSTSQTSFLGMAEVIPKIQPWYIRLSNKGSGDYAAEDSALYSKHELDSRLQGPLLGQNKQKAPRHVLFGVDKGSGLFGNSSTATASKPPPPPAAQSGGLFGSHPAAQSGGLFGSNPAAQGGGQFGSSLFSQPAQPNIAYRTYAAPDGPRGREEEVNPSDEMSPDLADPDTDTLTPSTAIAFQESTFSESGLTATYPVPGPPRTIPPSLTTRRHAIATVPLTAVEFSHIVVPKLKTAAFLKARIRNASSTTLLRGPCGLTLDGSFLGNTSLPRASPGEAFVLGLGVDPSVSVSYAKPSVRRGSSGVFQKEGVAVYARSCTITNTKGNRDLEELMVVDQVPVSQEEKLKVEVLVPRGLGGSSSGAGEGKGGVPAGTGILNSGHGGKGTVREVGQNNKEWGRAVARMKKDGAVEWEVLLKAGQGVRLPLEYEARFPGGEGVVGVN
ncbi:MAG: hypothetical protein Q9167_005544 [Letrouitia subvulpina]